MPRFICDSCAAGLYSAASPDRLIDPTCPTCGSPFERQREVAGLEPLPFVAIPAAARLELQP